MTLDDTLSEIEKKWPLELKEAQPASDTKRPMERNTDSLQEIRVKVAEFCGWEIPDHCITKRRQRGEKRLSGACPDFGKRPGTENDWGELPDYCNDLNACQSFEMRLNVNQWAAYADALDKICVPTHICPLTHWQAVVCATAVQRCDAFLIAVSAPSDPEAPKYSSATSVSSPKDSLSPEIVIPSLCKAVRRQQEMLNEVLTEKCDRDDFAQEIASILEEKEAV